MKPPLNLNNVHPSWQPIVSSALNTVDPVFLSELKKSNTALPHADQLLNAFSLPLDQTRYILFGESPYPRKDSANGYAFWDGAVTTLWSENGLSKRVNRATSLRNMMKMLLVAEGLLDANDTSPEAIAQLPKNKFVNTINELFDNLMQKGFLLLNASLSYRPDYPKQKEALGWRPFINALLQALHEKNHHPKLILFGKIASIINTLPVAQHFQQLKAEHPYNLSFINNTDVLEFFRSKRLLDNKYASTIG